MTLEKWLIHPGESRIIDVEGIRSLKVGLVGGEVDIIGHDEPGIRIEIHGVTVKDLRVEGTGDTIEIDHAQLRWDNVFEAFRNIGAGAPRAEVSIAVPRDIRLSLGVVSASALVSGLAADARLNTVSGDLIVDGLDADLSVNAVSGDVQVRALRGAITAKTVSGDIAVTGAVRSASVDTASGAMLIDAEGPVHAITLNTVSGNASVRLDADYAANYLVRTVGGRVQIDGIVRSGSGITTWTGSTGELSGSFVDVRAHSVSGDLTVLRREPTPPAAPSADAEAVA